MEVQLIAKRSGISYMLNEIDSHYVWTRKAWTGQTVWAFPRVKTIAEAFEFASDESKYDIYFGNCKLYFVSVGQPGCYPDYWELFPTYKQAEADYREYFSDGVSNKSQLEEGIYFEDASFFGRKELKEYILSWLEPNENDSHYPVLGTVNLNPPHELIAA